MFNKMPDKKIRDAGLVLLVLGIVLPTACKTQRPYSISEAGPMTIQRIRASEGTQSEQISLAQRAMQQAAKSLKPLPESLATATSGAIHDTMVFDYR